MPQDEILHGAIIASVDSFLEDYSFPSEESLSTAKNHHNLTAIDTLRLWMHEDEFASGLALESSLESSTGDCREVQEIFKTPAIRKTAQRKIRYRRKLKTERETLLKQSAELSTVLQKLRNAHAEKLREEGRSVALAVWKTIATQQKEKRLEVEGLHKRLRAEVISRSRVIEQMNSFLQCSDLARSVALCGHERAADRSALIDTFVNELDLLYSQTDQVVRHASLKMSSPMELNLTRKCKGGCEYFESANATTVPFGFEQTVKAMSSLMLSDWGEGFDKKIVKKPDCTIGYIYEEDYHLKTGEIAKLGVSTASRKYIETDRAVHVWRVLTEGQGDFEGLHADETGWMILRPSSTDSATTPSSGDNEVSTVVEIYTRVVQTGQTSPAIADRFTEVIAKTIEEEVEGMMKMLDKVLIGQPDNVKKHLRHNESMIGDLPDTSFVADLTGVLDE
ncbi:hypothetical protein PHYBOEH_007980 [Phytophthora boehmeriae]|uniref:M96 mating-specific protein family n=1 Tax=Phytophthora boehmeriae TaxID=109152 RepID=A0A8T1W7P8_9STRA|nr:hypothetical protein PHYBOEH_007980 [Phytophthora boehmeriae]